MRVGLVIYESLETLSGGYLYDRQLVDYLRRQGDTVEIVSLPWRNYLRHLGDNFSFTLFRQLVQSPVDVWLQDEMNHPSLFLLNRWLRSNCVPLISLVHHLRCCEMRPPWQNRFYRWVEGRYLSTVEACIYNSRTTRAAVTALVGRTLPGPVAYPGGDRFHPDLTPSAISQRAREPGPLRGVWVGNWIPRKGLAVLVKALAEMPHGSVEITLVGREDTDPVHAREIREQVARQGIGDRVRFAGRLSDAELAGVLRNSHVMVVPSSYEGFGIVYLEGMGFGLPAIGTTQGAAVEVITPGGDGFLIAPADAAALARHLMLLAQDRERLTAMSLAARCRYLAHPTWEESVGQIRNFLLERSEKGSADASDF